MILALLDGARQAAVAVRFNTRANTVNKWHSRFARLGLAGLDEAPRSEKPKTTGKAWRTRVLK